MTLRNKPVQNRRCPDCGREFHCGIADDAPCWCAAEFPALMPLTEAAAGCLCPECLERRISAQQDGARNSLT